MWQHSCNQSTLAVSYHNTSRRRNSLRSALELTHSSVHVSPYRVYHATPRVEEQEGSAEVAAAAGDEKEEVKVEPVATTTEKGEPTQYTSPELTADAAAHKAGLEDPERPSWQNPLHHDNADMEKIYPEDFESQEAFEAAAVPAPPLGDSAPAYLQEMADEVVHLTLLEMNELMNKIADHYGFHEGMLSPDDEEGGEDDDDDDEAEAPVAAEKTLFDIKLMAFDAKAKIKVIKEVRAIAGLGLKEAKEMVEGAPKVIQSDVKKEEAEEIKAKLEELGATVEIV